jgi:hypothetical protein
MQQIKCLFSEPESKIIGGLDFKVCNLTLENFDDAVQIATWAGAFAGGFDAQKLLALKSGTPERAALCRVLASSLTLMQPAPAGSDQPATPRALTPEDIDQMPVVMVVEAIAVVLETNLDFFFQTLPKLMQTAARLTSIGSASSSSSSAPGIGSRTSAATASPSFAAT